MQGPCGWPRYAHTCFQSTYSNLWFSSLVGDQIDVRSRCYSNWLFPIAASEDANLVA